MIGIGGIGMSAIAELLLRNGYQVSGSDLKLGELCLRLKQLGVDVFEGHRAENIRDAQLVVYSSAVVPTNPELLAAKEKDVLCISRAEILAELMRLKYGIAVAGAHGKTTTTSMIALALTEGGLDPTIVVGGRMDNFGGTNARLGSGDFMVVEADESDGTFNRLTPSIAVVTNMDREHMDHYQSMTRLKKAFVSFMNKVPFYGLTVVCGDDPQLRILLPRVTRRKKTYGFGSHCSYAIEEYRATPEGSECRVRYGKDRFTLKLRVPGKHNTLNALATVAVADELSVNRNLTLEALASYQGVQRRFHRRGEKNGILFIDDYAHHPTEILATLNAARERYPNARIRALFQPHRPSRVEDLFDQFSTCFKQSDEVAITEIYSAGESAREGVTGSVLAEAIGRTGHPHAGFTADPMRQLEKWIASGNPGDVILTMGAGDLPNVYRQLF